jgi:hypothetical protein
VVSLLYDDVSKKMNVFEQILEDALDYNCCKNCKFSYLRDESDMGYCKLSENAFGILPKMVSEMYVCKYWEKKICQR